MVRAMVRVVLVVAVALAGCAQTENDRPATVEYITEAILQPSCGQYTCHSSYRMEKGYAFDTVEASRRSLKLNLVVPKDIEASQLNTVLTRTIKRMPYDSPLPDKDIELIQTWIMGDAGKDLGLLP
jgi:hypothetical protein